MVECRIIDNPNLRWHHFDDAEDPELVVLAAQYSLHELAIGQCATLTSRAKLDDYQTYLFVVLIEFRNEEQPDRLVEEPLYLFVGDDFIITVSDGINRSVENAKQIIKTPWISERTSKDIFYLLFDYICDQYFPVIDEISEEISELEQAVYEKPDRDISRRATVLKKTLTLLRRAASSHRGIINQLLRKNPPYLQAPLNLYFRDIYDHLVQAMDLIETDRDLLTGVIDTNISATAHRTNEIVKTLTIYATALLPLNVITGYFGMNFVHLPFIHERWAVPIITTLLLLMLIGTAIYLRRRQW